MKLQRNLILYVFFVFLFLLGSFYFIFRSSMLSNIQYFEQQNATMEAESAVRHLEMELTYLNAFTEDWGAWTDTYLFAQGKNRQKYIDDNFSPESMSKQKFDFMIITNKKGDLVYGLGVNHAEVKIYPLSKALIDFAKNDVVTGKKVSGVKVVQGKIYVVSASPVLMNSYKGTPQGSMIVGREVVPEIIHLDSIGHEVNFSLLKEGSYEYFDGGHKTFIESETKKNILAAAIIKDIHNKPAVKATVNYDKVMYGYTQKKLFSLFLFLFLFSAIIAVAIIVLVHKIIYLQQRVFHTSRLASLGTLGAGIAHELNNPLAVVHGFAQNMENVLQEKNIKDEELKDSVSKIISYTNRMKNIIEKIGVFSKSGENINSSKVDDINSIVSDSLLLIRKELELKRISLELKFGERLPNVIINPIKIENVLHNIIMNAKEELEELPQKHDKKIVISTAVDEQENFVIVKIADNGRGIPSDNVFRVFDPFFTTKPLGKGTGLGLSIVYGIMRDINGKVEIETREGSGTTLILKIPTMMANK